MYRRPVGSSRKSSILALAVPLGVLLAFSQGRSGVEQERKAAVFIEYDEVWFVALKLPHSIADKKRRVFTASGASNAPAIAWADKITDAVQLAWLKTLLTNPKNFHGGTSDCTLTLYSLVFYRNGKGVLELSPNLVGNFLGATPEVQGVRTWSNEGIGEFARFCHCQMMVSIFNAESAHRALDQTLPRYENYGAP